MSSKVFWNKKTESGIEKVALSEMEDAHLQSSLMIVQKRQLKAVRTIEVHTGLEKGIREEAKKRGLELKDYDELKETGIAVSFKNSKEVIATVGRSIKRKKKQIENAKS